MYFKTLVESWYCDFNLHFQMRRDELEWWVTVWICPTGDNGGVIRLSSVVDCLSGSLRHSGNGQLSAAGAKRQPNTVVHVHLTSRSLLFFAI